MPPFLFELKSDNAQKKGKHMYMYLTKKVDRILVILHQQENAHHRFIKVFILSIHKPKIMKR